MAALTVSRSLETFLAWKLCTIPLPGFSPFRRLDLRLDFFDSPLGGPCACFPRSRTGFDEGSYRSGRVFRRGFRAYRWLDVLLSADSVCVASETSLPALSCVVLSVVGGFRFLVSGFCRGGEGSNELSDLLCLRLWLDRCTGPALLIRTRGSMPAREAGLGGSDCTVSSSHFCMSMLVYSRPTIRAGHKRAVPSTVFGLETSD